MSITEGKHVKFIHSARHIKSVQEMLVILSLIPLTFGLVGGRGSVKLRSEIVRKILRHLDLVIISLQTQAPLTLTWHRGAKCHKNNSRD